jgi:hypothetical protein
MAEEKKYISKVTLSDGSTYFVKDDEALKKSGGTVTGDVVVDGKIEANHLFILAVETMLYTPTNVLTQDESTNEIKKRDIDNLLEDIGGYSCNESDLADGILTLKLGK